MTNTRRRPTVTRQRIYLETMERVFGGTDKIILDARAARTAGVVPVLPLNRAQTRADRAAAGGHQ